MSLAEAVAAHQAGRLEEAERLYRESLEEEERPLALGNLGALLSQLGRPEDALEVLRRATMLEADRAAHFANFGIAACAVGQLEEGLGAFDRAELLEPHLAVHPFNAGRALALAGRHEAAADAAQRALLRDPHHAGARYNLALARLRMGRWQEAWSDYEARFAMAEGPHEPHPEVRWWKGEPLEGPLLLFADQGFGDTLMMARFLPHLQAHGVEVILQVEMPLHGLLAASFPKLKLLPPGPWPKEVAAKAALLSLPGLFNLAVDAIPQRVPYLVPPGEASEKVAAFFKGLPAGPKVALTWRGNPAHLQDRQRSMDPSLLAPLAKIQGVQWLAFTPGAEVLPSLPGIRDLGSVVRDFADSAHAMQQVDLLISVDSAPAHLAGALGRPGLVLLPFVPDWRWMLDRTDTPWYPTLELRRQDRPGDWASLVEKLVLELA
jgi:tetratricopeptide (TPR) repeat protein